MVAEGLFDLMDVQEANVAGIVELVSAREALGDLVHGGTSETEELFDQVHRPFASDVAGAELGGVGAPALAQEPGQPLLDVARRIGGVGVFERRAPERRGQEGVEGLGLLAP